MASQGTLYEFAKDNFKDTSSDLEDSLAEDEKSVGFSQHLATLGAD